MPNHVLINAIDTASTYMQKLAIKTTPNMHVLSQCPSWSLTATDENNFSLFLAWTLSHQKILTTLPNNKYPLLWLQNTGVTLRGHWAGIAGKHCLATVNSLNHLIHLSSIYHICAWTQSTRVFQICNYIQRHSKAPTNTYSSYRKHKQKSKNMTKII